MSPNQISIKINKTKDYIVVNRALYKTIQERLELEFHPVTEALNQNHESSQCLGDNVTEEMTLETTATLLQKLGSSANFSKDHAQENKDELAAELLKISEYKFGP